MASGRSLYWRIDPTGIYVLIQELRAFPCGVPAFSFVVVPGTQIIDILPFYIRVDLPFLEQA